MASSNAAPAAGPLLKFLTSAIVFADISVLNLADKYNLHQLYKLFYLFQKLLISSFLFFLGILPSFLSSFVDQFLDPNAPKSDFGASSSSSSEESGIGRALTQLLLAVNALPVSSRKYDLVRSLADLLIDENHREGFESLRELNRRVLSTAFARTLSQLERAAAGKGRCRRGGLLRGGWIPWAVVGGDWGLGRAFRAARGAVEVVLPLLGKGTAGDGRGEYSAEKMAAELLWMAQKMAACGIAEEAVGLWASASKLALLGLPADLRLQGSLVRVSAFLMKQAKAMEGGESGDGKTLSKEQIRQTKTNMLLSWLPLLCGASNGTDAPVLSCSERAELERVLEETIDSLTQDEQEKVLCLWLHNFAYCSESDWPNLRSSFLRWSATSRKLVVIK